MSTTYHQQMPTFSSYGAFLAGVLGAACSYLVIRLQFPESLPEIASGIGTDIPAFFNRGQLSLAIAMAIGGVAGTLRTALIYSAAFGGGHFVGIALAESSTASDLSNSVLVWLLVISMVGIPLVSMLFRAVRIDHTGDSSMPIGTIVTALGVSGFVFVGLTQFRKMDQALSQPEMGLLWVLIAIGLVLLLARTSTARIITSGLVVACVIGMFFAVNQITDQLEQNDQELPRDFAVLFVA